MIDYTTIGLEILEYMALYFLVYCGLENEDKNDTIYYTLFTLDS